MKKLQQLNLIVLFFIISSARAQVHPGTISGTVYGSDKRLADATISLLLEKDSSVIKTVLSNTQGDFTIDNIPTGKFLIGISAIGYQKIYLTAAISAASAQLRMQHILLAQRIENLAGVTVTAKRPPIEIRAGKTVVNVDASPANAGLNILEILEKSPGVAVDNEGNISLRGKGGVLILVDGKQTYLTGTQLAAFLRSMQAGTTDQIEIMTNPPARYDASGNAGVINIKTKKGTQNGFNANTHFNYHQGYFGKYSGGGNFNYRNNRFNLFGSADVGYWQNLGMMELNRNFFSKDQLSGSADQRTERINKSSWYNLKLGLDYQFTQKDVAGIVVTGNMNPWKGLQNGYSNLRDVEGALNSTFWSDALNQNKAKSIATNFNYKHSFDSTGREISFDLDYGLYHNQGRNLLSTTIFDGQHRPVGNPIFLKGELPSRIHIFTAKTDYVHRLGKESRLEAGLKTSFVNTDNNVLYLRDTGRGWETDLQRTNHFIYKENVNAAYAILTSTYKKWEFTGGLRIENTNAEGTQALNDSSFTRHYTNLFPNAGLVYTINDKHQLSATYSRRIRRPDYEDLNPFIYFLDSLTYGQGNPYLQPEFSNRIELNHTYNKFFTSTISYTETNSIITELLKQNSVKQITFQTKENFSSMRQWGASISLNRELATWWNLNLYTGIFHKRFSGIYSDGMTNTPVKIGMVNVDANITNSFSFGELWTAELGGWFGSNPGDGLLIADAMGSLNMAVARKIFNKKGTVKLGVRDLLRTTNFSGYSRYADVDISLNDNRRRDNRVISLSFSYKFGKNTAAPEHERRSGASEEQERIKSGS